MESDAEGIYVSTDSSSTTANIASLEELTEEVRELREEVKKMSQKMEVPVTGPSPEWNWDQMEYGHLDRTESIRHVIELGLRYEYEFRRAHSNIQLDISAGQSDLAILQANRLQVMRNTAVGEEG